MDEQLTFHEWEENQKLINTIDELINRNFLAAKLMGDLAEMTFELEQRG